jgi:general secretion pathway protein L
MKGNKIVASGHTVDASALLQRLSADSRLRNVRSPTAVTRQPGSNREAFTVEFTLEPSAPAAASQAPAAASLPTPAAAPAAAAAQAGSSPFVLGGSRQ